MAAQKKAKSVRAFYYQQERFVLGLIFEEGCQIIFCCHTPLLGIIIKIRKSLRFGTPDSVKLSEGYNVIEEVPKKISEDQVS